MHHTDPVQFERELRWVTHAWPDDTAAAGLRGRGVETGDKAGQVAGPGRRGSSGGPKILAAVAAEPSERPRRGQDFGSGALQLDAAGEITDARVLRSALAHLANSD